MSDQEFTFGDAADEPYRCVMKFYVVVEPPDVRGIYETWDACKAAVTGTRGARYQSVSTLEKAEAMLSGEGVLLPPGRYAFTDGNAAGGVGVVIVGAGAGAEDSAALTELSTSVQEIFRDAGLSGLESEDAITAALDALRNVLAEMAGLYRALLLTESGALTVVHDFEGVSAWMEGRWKIENPVVDSIVSACHALIRDRELEVSFRHQPGHQSTWAGRDDFARWNGRADELATAAAGP